MNEQSNKSRTNERTKHHYFLERTNVRSFFCSFTALISVFIQKNYFLVYVTYAFVPIHLGQKSSKDVLCGNQIVTKHYMNA